MYIVLNSAQKFTLTVNVVNYPHNEATLVCLHKRSIKASIVGQSDCLILLWLMYKPAVSWFFMHGVWHMNIRECYVIPHALLLEFHKHPWMYIAMPYTMIQLLHVPQTWSSYTPSNSYQKTAEKKDSGVWALSSPHYFYLCCWLSLSLNHAVYICTVNVLFVSHTVEEP